MVKNRIIVYIIFISIFSLHLSFAQVRDSLNCNNYFEYFDRFQQSPEIINYWSTPPLLKDNNTSVLCELCNILPKDSCDYLITTLILDKEGNPLCVKIDTDSIGDLLKEKVINLLYRLDFEPAIGFKDPIVSHYLLIINEERCKTYKYLPIHTNSQLKSKVVSDMNH